MEKENSKALPDKVVKPETIDTSGKTPKKTTVGEYKEKAKEAMKGYYGADTEITDDNYDSLVGGMAGEATVMKEKIGKYDAANKNIMAFMEDNPAMSGVLADVSSGAKFEQVLPKYVDIEALVDSKGGDETSWEENNKARMSNYEKIQAHKKKMEENEMKSIETVKAFVAEKKMEGENATEFGNKLVALIDAANSGDLTRELLDAVYYALNYESDIAMAVETGKVSAGNAKIEEKMKSEADLKGDGTPDLESTNEAVETKAGSGDEIADSLEKIIKSKRNNRF
jgi:hypothetical protein